MDIQLKDISSENWREAIKLAVKDDQKDFVTPNILTLVESKFVPDSCSILKGIYVYGEMVGFLWITYNIVDNSYRIPRFMIDSKYQGQGYGKQTLLELIEQLKKSQTFFPAEN